MNLDQRYDYCRIEADGKMCVWTNFMRKTTCLKLHRIQYTVHRSQLDWSEDVGLTLGFNQYLMKKRNHIRYKKPVFRTQEIFRLARATTVQKVGKNLLTHKQK